MDTERRRRIKEVFTTVLDMPPALRTAWLDEALSGDPTLVEEVRGLVAAFEGGDEAVEQVTLAAGPELRRELQTAVEGLRIGPYRILSELGRGGMGAVYLAVRDDEAYEQKVAIKLVKRGMDTDEIVHRFVHERKILAGLAHPNIARLLDGGTTPDGRPYFVMEYVEGRRITVFAREEDLGVEAKLRLFVKVCSAVQFAHQNLIVHRDLKPGNLLVDRDGEPKLLDFGIAKLLAPPSLGGLSELTRAHQRPMTPDYASPEQIAGGAVTTATDVYGLGIVLYELLVGQNPSAIRQQLGEGWAERPPSQAIKALGGDSRLSRQLQGDLDNIIGKALERDPQRRYATAAALAEDLERHLDRRPVKARRPTVGYRLGRTLVRHKLASAFVVAVVVFAGIAGSLALKLKIERDRAEDLRRQAEKERDLVIKTADSSAKQGHYETSEKLLHNFVKLRKGLMGRDDQLAKAVSLTLLGQLACDQGHYAESFPYYRSAIAIKKQYLGSQDPSLAEDLNGMGRAWTELEDFAKAAEYLKEGEDISRQAGLRGQQSLAVNLNNQGEIAKRTGHLAEARQLFQEALDIGRTLRDADLREILNTERNLASVFMEQKDYAKAESLFQDVLKTQERVMGADHRELILTLSMLGMTQFHQEHYPAAAASLQRALDLRRQLAIHDADEAVDLTNYAVVLKKQGDLRGAEENYRKSLQLYRGLKGDYRVETAGVLYRLSQVRLDLGDLREAEALVRESLELSRKAGASDREVAASLLQLAKIERKARRPQEAEAHERQARELNRLTQPPVNQ